ncbi:MAG: hypothetical protein R3F02_06230 [Thiolinea sp.]
MSCWSIFVIASVFLNVLTDNPPPVPLRRRHQRFISRGGREIERKHSEAIKLIRKRRKKWKENLLPLPAYYRQHLSWMLSLIRDLRNTTTHPTEPEETIDFRTQRRL